MFMHRPSDFGTWGTRSLKKVDIACRRFVDFLHAARLMAGHANACCISLTHLFKTKLIDDRAVEIDGVRPGPGLQHMLQNQERAPEIAQALLNTVFVL